MDFHLQFVLELFEFLTRNFENEEAQENEKKPFFDEIIKTV